MAFLTSICNKTNEKTKGQRNTKYAGQDDARLIIPSTIWLKLLFQKFYLRLLLKIS